MINLNSCGKAAATGTIINNLKHGCFCLPSQLHSHYAFLFIRNTVLRNTFLYLRSIINQVGTSLASTQMDVYIGERVNCLILVQVLSSLVMNMQQSTTFSLRKARTVKINSLKRRQILLSVPKSPFQSLISMQGTLNTGEKNSETFNEI